MSARFTVQIEPRRQALSTALRRADGDLHYTTCLPSA
jgi:hypothetical protein